jgi:hypothetical protein
MTEPEELLQNTLRTCGKEPMICALLISSLISLIAIGRNGALSILFDIRDLVIHKGDLHIGIDIDLFGA